MNIVVPLNKKVIVEAALKETKSKGGIIIPEAVNQKAPTKGTVIAIAEDSKLLGMVDGVKLHPATLAAGDIVLFSKYAGIEITLKATKVDEIDKNLLIIDDDKILAKIEHREN